MPISALPPLLVNQIAAGEVIERPASVVKELVENAVDAGADRIHVTIEEGGRELIRVVDNGCGIAFDELGLAIAPHATSKISAAADLDAIATLGFRGEALASIASVARLQITSRPADHEGPACIEVEGGETQPPRPVGASPGTTVTVRNLFYNTPARRKFLRTDQTETSRVVEVVQNLAIAHPAAAVRLDVDGRCRFELSPAPPRQRVLGVLGEELADHLLEMNTERHGLGLWGLVGLPEIARGTARSMRVFLNGRPINDRSVNHAVREAYRGLIEHGRYPTIVLLMQIDPALVDVNVHPAKAEVRFRHQALVHAAVLSAVRARLQQSDLTPALDLGRTEAGREGGHGGGPIFEHAAAGSPSPGADAGSTWPGPPESQARWRSTGGFVGGGGAGRGAAGHAPTSVEQFVEQIKRLDPRQKGFVYQQVREALAPEEVAATPGTTAAGAGPSAQPIVEELSGQAAPLPTFRHADRVLQVHDSYLVTQDEQGLLIIDQHALHERVIFEKLKERIGAGSLVSQRLLMPATVEVDRAHLEALDALQPMLQRLGIEAEPMGPRTLAIHAFTALLFERNVSPEPFMLQLLDSAVNRGLSDDPEAAIHEVLDMMACKAAVKAGDRLTTPEIDELLKYRGTVDRSSNCPHGRPTTLRLTLADLDRQFGRK